MTEQVVEELDVVKVSYYCDDCEEEVISKGYAMSNEAGRSCAHYCPECKEDVWLDKYYPCIKYVTRRKK